VLALGTRKAFHSETVFGSGFAHEQRIKDSIATQKSGLGVDPAPVEMNITTRVDHFNASNPDTYEMRYIIDWTFYNASQGPILFYAGNEGGIWNFYNNSGFVTKTLAEKYGALVVFAEHRFYGTSMPYGVNAFDRENLRFLTIEQVMWDYVDLLNVIKANTTDTGLKDRATILFGGSYGGMLASWMRMKYPNHFQGALASSAPILWFKGKTDPNDYTIVASKVFKKVGGQECYDSLQRGFFDLTNLMYDPTKYQGIADTFNMCDVPTHPANITTIIGIMSDSLGTMAMVNYPYATNFVNPLPAWPMTEACVQAKNSTPAAIQVGETSIFNYTNIEAL
jgi:lysosomal Pro-X carboxypeptidase